MWKAFRILFLFFFAFVRLHSLRFTPFQPRLTYIVDITRTWKFFSTYIVCLPRCSIFMYIFRIQAWMKNEFFSLSPYGAKAQSSWTMCVLLCFDKENFSEIPSLRLEGRTQVSWRGMRWRARAKFDRIIVDLMWYPSLLFEQRFNRVQRRVRGEKILVRPPFSFLRPRPYCIRANSLIPIFWFASDAIDCEMRMLTHNSFCTHAQWEHESESKYLVEWDENKKCK